VRVAFSGSHRVGKSTLVERVADALPGYETVDEPYFLLEEDGHESSDPPSVEDFEAQLERSILAIEESGPDALFDRCPADVVAYLLVADGDVEIARVRAAMRRLDLVVWVPIESEDHIPVAAHEDRGWRAAVDAKLGELFDEDAFGLGRRLVTVRGDVRRRLEQVMARIARG